MSRIVLFFALAFTLPPAVSPAWAEDHGLFLEFSGGGTARSQTPFPIQGLEPSQTYELGLGYMLTEHIGIIPLSVGYQRFKSSDAVGGYIDHGFLQYQRNVIERDLMEGDVGYYDWPDYGRPEGTAELIALIGRTSVTFRIPFSSRLSGITSLGAVVLRNTLTTESSGAEFREMNRKLSQIETHYGFSLGGGIERELREGVSVIAKLNYDKLFNHTDQKQTSVTPTAKTLPAARVVGVAKLTGWAFGEVIPRSRTYFYNFSIGIKVGL